MRFLVLVAFFSISWIEGFTQDITIRKISSEVFRSVKKEGDDTIPWIWKRGGLVNANLAQGSLSNWAAGGDQFSMSLNAYVNYSIFYKEGRRSWDNNLEFNLGYIQSTSLGSRKNDDRFDILSKYGYKIDTANRWYLTALGNFRSQFFDGYTYSGGKSTFSSTLFSPAYALASIGMDYKRNTHFSLFLSPITSRWVIVANRALSDSGMYGVPRGKHFNHEFGGFASVNYNTPLSKNVSYKVRLDLFSNYLNNPENIDIYMTNLVSFKINRYLSATYNLDLIYDDDVKLFRSSKTSPALQLKSMIGIGFQMKFPQVFRSPAAEPVNNFDPGVL